MHKLLVEFVGTFFFLYVILATGNFLAIGAALALVVYLGGKISGGNFNPAVTIMMVMANKQNADTLFPYIIAQILGGLCALQLYKMVKWSMAVEAPEIDFRRPTYQGTNFLGINKKRRGKTLM